MIAMLLAAQLSAASVGGMQADGGLPDVRLRVALTATRNGLPVQPQVICQPQGAMQTSGPALLLRPQDRKNLRVQKLADLPKANKEVAVARTIGGCAVPVGIRYSVEGDGRFAKGK